MQFQYNPRIVYQCYRSFSSNYKNKYPINIVLGPLLPAGITYTAQFQKKWNKTPFNPIEVDATSLDIHSDTINDPNVTVHVGYFDQYPTRSNQNCAIFTQRVIASYRMPKKSWRCNTEDVNINMKFPIDSHPFDETYKKSKDKSIWKKNKRITLESLGIVTPISDAMDNNLPILMRKLDKKRKQTLVCWRDCHVDIKNLKKIEILIKELKPDLIISECPISTDVLRPYQSIPYKYIIHPYLQFIQQFIPKSFEFSCAEILGKMMRIASCSNIPIAYAHNSALMIAIQNNIDLCLADYPEELRNKMNYLSDVLDLYQWFSFPVDINKLNQLYIKRCLPAKLENLAAARLKPHMLTIGDYRNDLMALAINESAEEHVNVILFIVGSMHWLDICDKLCGKAEIINPFKEMTNNHLILKQLNPLHYTGQSKIKLNKQEIEQCIHQFGIDIIALLMIPKINYKTHQEMYQAMDQWKADWIQSNGKTRAL